MVCKVKHINRKCKPWVLVHGALLLTNSSPGSWILEDGQSLVTRMSRFSNAIWIRCRQWNPAMTPTKKLPTAIVDAVHNDILQQLEQLDDDDDSGTQYACCLWTFWGSWPMDSCWVLWIAVGNCNYCLCFLSVNLAPLSWTYWNSEATCKSHHVLHLDIKSWACCRHLFCFVLFFWFKKNWGKWKHATRIGG